MKTRAKGSHNQQTTLISIIIIEADVEVTYFFPAMTEANKIIDKSHMIGIEKAMHLDPHPEKIILHKDCIQSKTIIIIKMTTDSLDLEGQPDPLPGGPELYHGHPLETMAGALPAENLVILPENVLRRTLLQAKSNIGKKDISSTETFLICMEVNKTRKKRRRRK